MNKKRHWLRGGIIGLLAGMITVTFAYIYVLELNNLLPVELNLEMPRWFESVLGILHPIFAFWWFGCALGAASRSELYLCPIGGIIFSTLSWGLVGITIGWIYGFIKNHNNTKHPMI